MKKNPLILVLATAVVVTGAAFSAWVVKSVWLGVLFSAPLVLFLPGYAIVLALDVEGRLGGVERWTIAVGTSLTLAALLGLALGSVGIRLSSDVWILSLGAASLVPAGMAARRMRLSGVEAEGTFRQGLAFVGGLAVVAVVSIAALSVAQKAFPLASSSGEVLQMWALPESATDTSTLVIGIRNQVSPVTMFRLDVSQGGRSILVTAAPVPLGGQRTYIVRRLSDATEPVAAALVDPRTGASLRRTLSWPNE